MRPLFPPFMRTTTFRLALIYTFVFLLSTSVLVLSLYWGTVGYIKSESNARVDKELAYFVGLEEEGLAYLAREIFERSGQPNYPFYYYLEDENGQTITGIFQKLPVQTTEKITPVIFDMIVIDEMGRVDSRKASGKIAKLAGGHLLVAQDSEQLHVMIERFSGSIIVFGFASLAMSLLGGVLMSRSAARRAEILSATANAVIQGDLSKRVEVNTPGDEFDRLGTHINTMLGQLEKLIQSAQNSGNALAHDLRSPLTRLRNRLDRAQHIEHDADSARETIGVCLEQTEEILKTFNAILSLSNIGTGMAGKFEPVDISELMQEISELYEPSASEAELGLSFKTDAGLQTMGNRTLIAQALANLIDNAIKYTPAGGHVTLNAKKANKEIVIDVQDTGIGISTEDAERVKERFVRLDNARSKSGSGLGLTMVEAVIQAHNGKFEINKPKPAKGVLARIRLPITTP